MKQMVDNNVKIIGPAVLEEVNSAKFFKKNHSKDGRIFCGGRVGSEIIVSPVLEDGTVSADPEHHTFDPKEVVIMVELKPGSN